MPKIMVLMRYVNLPGHYKSNLGTFTFVTRAQSVNIHPKLNM